MEFRFLLTLSDRIKHNQFFVTFFANSDLKLICHLIRLCKEDNANQIITTEFYFKIHYIFEGQVSYNCTIFTIVISKKEQNFLIKLFFKYTFLRNDGCIYMFMCVKIFNKKEIKWYDENVFFLIEYFYAHKHIDAPIIS